MVAIIFCEYRRSPEGNSWPRISVHEILVSALRGRRAGSERSRKEVVETGDGRRDFETQILVHDNCGCRREGEVERRLGVNVLCLSFCAGCEG